MKDNIINIKNNLPKIEYSPADHKCFVSKHGNTVVYYKTLESKNYRKRLSESMIQEIISMEDSYSQKD